MVLFSYVARVGVSAVTIGSAIALVELLGDIYKLFHIVTILR